MKKLVYLFLLIIIGVTLSGCSFPLLKGKKAGLRVETNVRATVFLNDTHLGQTPLLSENLKAGEYTLKIVPDTSEKPRLSWQGIIRLSPGITTLVSRNLEETEEKSSGYVLVLEPILEKEKTKASIITTPSSVVVNVDGEPKGFSPLMLEDLGEGEKKWLFSAPGFSDLSFKAKMMKGYKLLINVQLAKEEDLVGEKEKEATSSAVSKEEEKDKIATGGGTLSKPYVKVKNTPTGWLNVRSEPSTSGGEETIITKVNPGEEFKFIEATAGGWYKIEYEKGKQGWVSSRYVELYQ